jgi:hypothetical protein
MKVSEWLRGSVSDFALEALGMGLSANLPALDGVAPPAQCPLCGRRQVPPESDAGLPPPEEWEYACGSSYALPEDEDAPQRWEPCKPCSRIATPQALSWVRDFCRADPRLDAVASVISADLQAAAPYPVERGMPVAVTLPPIQGEYAPDACPVCSRATTGASAGPRRYACGASYWATSTRPGPGGAGIPMTWRGLGPCGQPPLEIVLHVLRARGEPEWMGLCERAIAAIHERTRRRLG